MNTTNKLKGLSVKRMMGTTGSGKSAITSLDFKRSKVNRSVVKMPSGKAFANKTSV